MVVYAWWLCSIYWLVVVTGLNQFQHQGSQNKLWRSLPRKQSLIPLSAQTSCQCSVSGREHEVGGLTLSEVCVVFDSGMGVTILEATSEAQEILVNSALEAVEDGDGDDRGIRDFEQDPYGVVLWPSAKLVGNVLLERFSSAELQALTILELGTGTGLVSLVAARAGCKKVIATDFNPLTLSIVKRAAVVNGVPEGCITTQIFDVKAHSTQPLPSCDLLLVADMLYEPATAVAVARRVAEAVRMNDNGGAGVRVIVGDSPNRPGRPHFVSALKELIPERAGEIEFVKIAGESVVGVRNDLISDERSVTDQPRALEMGLLTL